MSTIAWLMRQNSISAIWTSGYDVTGNDVITFPGTGSPIPDALWARGQPDHEAGDYVYYKRFSRLYLGPPDQKMDLACEMNA